MDVSQLPCNENTEKQYNRKANAKGKRFGHAISFFSLILTIAHHEKKRVCEAT